MKKIYSDIKKHIDNWDMNFTIVVFVSGLLLLLISSFLIYKTY